MSRDRIEQVYDSLDEMAAAVKNNEPDDPGRPGKNCKWPETFLAWKENVKDRERRYGSGPPLTDLQWSIIELYMTAQHSFPKIVREEAPSGHPSNGS